MRIYEVEEIKPSPQHNDMWSNKDHRIFRFRFHHESIPNYSELVDWVLRQKTAARMTGDKEMVYSLTAHYESYVILQNRIESGPPRVTHYDLRSYNKKASAWVRKCWFYPKSEYEKNLKDYNIRYARMNGHIMIDGKVYGIGDLMPKPGVKSRLGA